MPLRGLSGVSSTGTENCYASSEVEMVMMMMMRRMRASVIMVMMRILMMTTNDEDDGSLQIGDGSYFRVIFTLIWQ